MQFGIGRLILVVTLVAILCGLIFAAPPVIGVPLLSLFLLSSPAIWIAGIVYARGALQAFFIGGTVAGIAPWTAAFYWQMAIVVQAVGDFPATSNNLGDIWKPAVQGDWYLANLVVLAPGVASFAGGAMAMLVYWTFRQAPTPPIST